MSNAIRLITPNPNHLGIYGRIWNTSRENVRLGDTNICRGCRHQIMLTETDYKKVISKLSSHHRRVYYHGEECHICGKVCGEFLLNGESKPI